MSVNPSRCTLSLCFIRSGDEAKRQHPAAARHGLTEQIRWISSQKTFARPSVRRLLSCLTRIVVNETDKEARR